VTEFDPAMMAYYDQGKEAERLTSPTSLSGPLEFARTQELVLRFLPDGILRILDVGGGPGAYAEWLAGMGHHVTLFDPVPLHVEQARSLGISAELGDARHIDRDDASADALLLLGPLYHLIDGDDRLQALREARRVTRPGGVIFAAAISRYAAFLDLVVRLDRLHEAEVADAVAASLESGVMDGRAGLFTKAYLHRPAELVDEANEAGLSELRLFNIEGPGFMVNNLPERWADKDRREALMLAARLVEEDPEMMATAGHLLVVGRS
jgi:SAM-dependent methyltransferase